MKSVRLMAESSQFATIALQQSDAIKNLAQFNELSSFNTLKYLENSPFIWVNESEALMATIERVSWLLA
jgi:hypothetical protein